MRGSDLRHELTDVHIGWGGGGRCVLCGFKCSGNDGGKSVDGAQSGLCSLEFETIIDLSLSKIRNVRPEEIRRCF
jgi:hypothetical protein